MQQRSGADIDPAQFMGRAQLCALAKKASIVALRVTRICSQSIAWAKTEVIVFFDAAGIPVCMGQTGGDGMRDYA
jgi:hypothetical protein